MAIFAGRRKYSLYFIVEFTRSLCSPVGGQIRDEERTTGVQSNFQKVCENKEVNKLLTTLSSLVSSYRKVTFEANHVVIDDKLISVIYILL